MSLRSRASSTPLGRRSIAGEPLESTEPASTETADFALGCFWGAERVFWTVEGVESTEVGYEGGTVIEPTYEAVCDGDTGHAEAVRVVYDPDQVSYAELLVVFFEAHDPTQRDRQGADVGTQYRSALFVTDEQRPVAEEALRRYDEVLSARGFPPIATSVSPVSDWWPAEDYHQRYLEKHPGGYCGLGSTGVSCPVAE